MNHEYTHSELGKDIIALAGYYTPRKEVRLKYGGREVLYIVGQVTIDNACCGTGQWTYALVPGYILKWQGEQNAAGVPVSEVEPIPDIEARNEISLIIREQEGCSEVEFW